MVQKDRVDINIDDNQQLDFESDFRADQGVDLQKEKDNIRGKKKNVRLHDHSRNWGILFFTMFMPFQCYILQYFFFFELLKEKDGSKRYPYYANLAFVVLNFILNLQTYYKCVMIKNTPHNKQPIPVGDKNLEEFYQNDKACQNCQNNWKPIRTSHCSTCRQCTLKMDHHCPWIDNCVGHKNHQTFLLFSLYMALGALQYTVNSARYIFYLNEKESFFGEHNILFYLYWFFVSLILFPMTLMLCGLVVFHSFSAISNMTTLQNMSGAPSGCPFYSDQDPEKMNKKRLQYINIYDLGIIANIAQFFQGDRYFFWLGREKHPYNDGSIVEMNPPVTKIEYTMHCTGKDFPKDVFGRVDKDEVIDKFEEEMEREQEKYQNKLCSFGPQIFTMCQQQKIDEKTKQKIVEQMNTDMMELQQKYNEIVNLDDQQAKMNFLQNFQEQQRAIVAKYQNQLLNGISDSDQNNEQQQSENEEQKQDVETDDNLLN